MTIDTRAIREMVERLSGIDVLAIDPATVISLCDEVDRLRAALDAITDMIVAALTCLDRCHDLERRAKRHNKPRIRAKMLLDASAARDRSRILAREAHKA